MSSALVGALRASECRLQKPDGQRCEDKVHQVPPTPVELYERIKGFAKLCHEAVNHCHGRLLVTVPATARASGAVVEKSITSSVSSPTSTSTPLSHEGQERPRKGQIEVLQP